LNVRSCDSLLCALYVLYMYCRERCRSQKKHNRPACSVLYMCSICALSGFYPRPVVFFCLLVPCSPLPTSAESARLGHCELCIAINSRPIYVCGGIAARGMSWLDQRARSRNSIASESLAVAWGRQHSVL
jgi:hypothetical protein